MRNKWKSWAFALATAFIILLALYLHDLADDAIAKRRNPEPVIELEGVTAVKLYGLTVIKNSGAVEIGSIYGYIDPIDGSTCKVLFRNLTTSASGLHCTGGTK